MPMVKRRRTPIAATISPDTAIPARIYVQEFLNEQILAYDLAGNLLWTYQVPSDMTDFIYYTHTIHPCATGGVFILGENRSTFLTDRIVKLDVDGNVAADTGHMDGADLGVGAPGSAWIINPVLTKGLTNGDLVIGVDSDDALVQYWYVKLDSATLARATGNWPVNLADGVNTFDALSAATSENGDYLQLYKPNTTTFEWVTIPLSGIPNFHGNTYPSSVDPGVVSGGFFWLFDRTFATSPTREGIRQLSLATMLDAGGSVSWLDDATTDMRTVGATTAAHDGRGFYMNRIATNNEEIMARSLTDGSLLWNRDRVSLVPAGSGTFTVRGIVVADDGDVVVSMNGVSGASDTLFKLDPATGATQWSKSLVNANFNHVTTHHAARAI